jgi:ubiquinone/menaquinone biosynthesis C-methylase UbiE
MSLQPSVAFMQILRNFETVTERPGSKASKEQLSMLYTRYAYAASMCSGKDVLEVACGSGPGLGYLARTARIVVGGDLTWNLLHVAHSHYGPRIPLLQLDAEALPFPEACFDVILMYEAIYYLPNPEKFLKECRRILRPGGKVILCSVNKEWTDFNPSPFFTRYFSAKELKNLFTDAQYIVDVKAGFHVAEPTLNVRFLSLIKRMAVRFQLIPKTMKGKEIVKRLVFGPLVSLPLEVYEGMAVSCPLVTVPDSTPLAEFKVLFATGTKTPQC